MRKNSPNLHPMEKMLDKFSNPKVLLKIIFILMGGLAVHIRFLSAFMGR
jgi:hypothetical protein